MQTNRSLRYAFGACTLLGAAVALSCSVEAEGPSTTDGGAGGVGGAGGAGSGGTQSTGGSGGTGGSTGGSGGTGGSTGGSGGSTGGSGGTGGSTGGANATGGAGPAAGTGGSTGGSGAGVGGSYAGTGNGMGGASGSGGSTSGGKGGTGQAGTGTAAGSGGSGGAMPSSGCNKAPPASMRYSMDVDGTMREYILSVPTDYDQTRPYKLIFAWHPLGGNAQQTAGTGNGGYYGMKGASGGNAILVSPEGLEQSGGGNQGWWNAGGGDIAFFRAMVDKFKAEMCIDEDRIFSTGFSFGGMMSYAVGCTGVVRAIAPMAGNSQVSGCTNGATPVAMMGFHGVNDSVVAISGGRNARDIFVERNGCTDETVPVASPSWCDGINANQQPCSCVSYQGCMAGYPTIWCEFNADHTPAPNSAATIWNFFSQF